MKKYIDIKSFIKQRFVKYFVFLLSMFVLIAGYSFKTEWTFYNRLNCLSGNGIEYLGFVIGRYILYFAATFSALFILLILYNIMDKTKSQHYIVKCGKQTLFFYAAHVTILFNTLKPFVSMVTNGKGILAGYPVVRYYVIAIMITFIVIVIMEKIYTLIEKNKYTSIFILGR